MELSLSGMFVRTNDFRGGTRGSTEIDGAGRMVLYPLTEVGIRMFMAVRVSGRELMVHILSCSERSQRQKEDDDGHRKQAREWLPRERATHRGALSSTGPGRLSKRSSVREFISLIYNMLRAGM